MSERPPKGWFDVAAAKKAAREKQAQDERGGAIGPEKAACPILGFRTERPEGGKPLLVPNCPNPVAKRWLMCSEHFALVPTLPARGDNRRFPKGWRLNNPDVTELSRVTLQAARFYFTLWDRLDRIGLEHRCDETCPEGTAGAVTCVRRNNLPLDETHAGPTELDGTWRRDDHPARRAWSDWWCLCAWCAPLTRRVLRVLEIRPSLFQVYARRAAQAPPDDVLGAWIAHHESEILRLERETFRRSKQRIQQPALEMQS